MARGGSRPNTGGKRAGAGRRPGAKELATTLRDAAKKAIANLEKKGKGRSLAAIIERELEAHPADMLRVLTGLIPKEHEIAGKNGQAIMVTFTSRDASVL